MTATATPTKAGTTAGAGTKPRPFRPIMSTLNRLCKEAAALGKAAVNTVPGRLETLAADLTALAAEFEAWHAAHATGAAKGGGGNKAGG